MRLLVPVILLDSITVFGKEQPLQPAPVLALGWVPLELYYNWRWGVRVKGTRRRSWALDHFFLGAAPVLVPGGCMVWSNAPTIELVGRGLAERWLRYR
jgi:hypothetical protein